MLSLVRKTTIQSSRCLMTTSKFCGGDTTTVSYEEAKPYSSVPSPFSLPLIGNGYLLAMKHESGVTYAKQAPLLHYDLTQKLGPIYKVNYFGFKQIMVSDPEHMETVLRSEGPNDDFPDGEFPSSELYPTNDQDQYWH